MARSTFPSQNVQNTPRSDHFWKLRCRKSARRCGAKHISKSKCTKHTSVGPLLEVAMSKKCTRLWREAHFQVKMYKTHHVRTTFGSCDVEKVHAVVARSTFPSQNVQNTPRSDHFWKLRCRKSARRCGAKHISKSKCTKHTTFGPLLEVEMSKKCTPLWREAHFEQNVKNTRGSDHFWRFRCRKSARRCGAKHISNKMLKTPGVRTTFGGSDVEKVHAVVARSTFRSQKFGPLLEVQMSLRFTTLHYITLQDITLHYTPAHYITLHYTPVHSTTLNYTTPHYITLHYAPLHYTTSHYTTLHSTTLHYTVLHYLPLHFTTLHYTTPHHTTTTTATTQLHSTTLHYTKLHYTTLHSATLHYTTLHYTTLPYTE